MGQGDRCRDNGGGESPPFSVASWSGAVVTGVLVGVGAVCWQRDGRFERLSPHGPFGHGSFSEAVGGALFHALAAAVRKGADTALLSLRGGDTAGDRIAEALANAGIADLSAVFLDRQSPSRTLLSDPDGRPLADISDFRLIKVAMGKQLRRSGARGVLGAASAVLVDTSLPEEALERTAAHAGAHPIYAIGVDGYDSGGLSILRDRLDGVFLEHSLARDFAATGIEATPAELGSTLTDAGIPRGLVFGERWILGFEHGAAFEMALPDTVRLTGAQRASLCGGTMAGLIGGKPLKEAFTAAASV